MFLKCTHWFKQHMFSRVNCIPAFWPVRRMDGYIRLKGNTVLNCSCGLVLSLAKIEYINYIQCTQYVYNRLCVYQPSSISSDALYWVNWKLFDRILKLFDRSSPVPLKFHSITSPVYVTHVTRRKIHRFFVIWDGHFWKFSKS